METLTRFWKRWNPKALLIRLVHCAVVRYETRRRKHPKGW